MFAVKVFEQGIGILKSSLCGHPFPRRWYRASGPSPMSEALRRLSGAEPRLGHAVKPAPGMIRNAMRDLGFDPGEAVVIGDSDADMGAALAAGVRVASAGGPTATGAQAISSKPIAARARSSRRLTPISTNSNATRGMATMASYGAEFLPDHALHELGFASVGKEVKIHPSAILVSIENIHIGNHSRIDAYTIITASSPVRIGAYVHIGAGCYLAGGGGITVDDLSTLSQGVKIYSINDDYSGASLTNPTVPSIYKLVKEAPVHLGRHVIVGAGSVVLPGVNIAEGSAIGALSLVSQATAPWGIYGGTPTRRLKERRRDLLAVEKRFLQDYGLPAR